MKGSPSWPWPGRCCASLTWSHGGRRGPGTAVCASTATGACPRSTAAPAAWRSAPAPEPQTATGPSSSSESPGTIGASRSQPSGSVSRERVRGDRPPSPSGSSIIPSRTAICSGSSSSAPASSSSFTSSWRLGSSDGSSSSSSMKSGSSPDALVDGLVALLEGLGGVVRSAHGHSTSRSSGSVPSGPGVVPGSWSDRRPDGTATGRSPRGGRGQVRTGHRDVPAAAAWVSTRRRCLPAPPPVRRARDGGTDRHRPPPRASSE